MSALDYSGHAEFRAAEGDHSHKGSFKDVAAACDQWLRARGILPGRFFGNPYAKTAETSRLERKTRKRCYRG